jgi:hypothetical protein
LAWDALGSVAEVVAAVSVILTVLYLARQIRDASASNEARTYFEATESLNQHYTLIAQDGELSRIYFSGNSDPNSLTKEELSRYLIIIGGIFARYNNFHRQYQQGNLPEDMCKDRLTI